ncbi:MAG TPA: FAD-binding oxidoreductase [Dehalococcoidia bacterium]|nr:FAD-binding oxidoreductase [Dehalococcoidia bacterium]
MARAPDLMMLAETLRSLLPGEALDFDPGDEYGVDGMTPLLVARAGSQADVAAVLKAASEARAAVVPRGGGTLMALGMPPERYDVALDLRGLDALVEYEPADLTVTVEAGMEIDRLASTLRERGQMLPLGTFRDQRTTIGGVLATNLHSPGFRHMYGAARDLCIGMTVALSSGEIVKSGGRVVKNVAGYDMGKLHIGALGTLGVILQASFKVVPEPAASGGGIVHGERAALETALRALLEARLALRSASLTREASEEAWRLSVGFAGSEAAVERSQREFRAIAGDSEDNGPLDAVSRAYSAVQNDPVCVRATVPVAQTGAMARALADAGASVVSEPTLGSAHGSWGDAAAVSEGTVASLRRRAIEAGGALIVERAPVELKRAADVWGEPRGDFALMRRLKAQFDAAGTLNPGRYVGGI